MKIKHVFWIALLALVSIAGCHKDSNEDYNQDITTTFQPKVYQEITGSIIGFVYDEQGHPVSGAQVAIYSTATQTNAYGIFYFKNVKMDRQGTYIKVIKEGFFLGSDIVYPLEKGATNTRIKLLKLDNSQSFIAKNGGKITLSDSVQVSFPAGSVANADGTLYNGKVLISARFLNPNHADMGDMMPGGLMADGANGNTYILGTLGMLAIELHDENGKTLNIFKGKQATIEMPAVTGYKASTVPFWYFDEHKGRWQEEGVATLQGDKYVATVNHFSFWNLDVPYPLVQLCGEVLYENGNPAQNVNLKIEVDGLGCRYGYINESGQFCGKVPKGKTLKISIHSNICNKVLAEVTINPLHDDTQMNKIIVEKLNEYTITGTLTCQGTAPDAGIVVVKTKGTLYPFPTNKDGHFSLNISAFVCNPNDEVKIFGFDNTSNKSSNEILIDKINKDNLILEMCQTGCPLNGKIVFDCDTTLSVQITSGSGQYTYLWENKATSAFIHVPQYSLFNPKTYCVTVTDVVNKCSMTFCNLFSKPDLGIESDCQGGIIHAYPHGGKEPYSIIWSDGSTEKDLVVLKAGKYCVTMTDGLGCPVIKCIDFSPLTLNPTPISCSKNTYSFDSSPFSTGNFFPISGQPGRITYPFVANIFDTGFKFSFFISNDNCSYQDSINLPQLINGLTTKAIHTSCGSCSDGKIEIEIKSSAVCESCVVGSTKVFKTDNLNTDLSAQNNDGKLATGNYYVVVTDKTTGCYIAFEKVKIN